MNSEVYIVDNPDIRGLRATGIIRKVDELGRLVIPKPIIKRFGYKERQAISIVLVENEFIVLSPIDEEEVGRRLDDLNRIVIPKELRDRLGIIQNMPMEVFVAADRRVVLKTYRETCCACGKTGTLSVIRGNKKICDICANWIKENL